MHDLSPVLAELKEQVERAQLEKIETFFRLLFDPDLAPYVYRLPQYLSRLPRPYRINPSIPNVFKGLRYAILSLSLPERFTSADVMAGLEAMNFQFRGKRPINALCDAMRKLCEGRNPEFRIIDKGKGGRFNIYERREANDGPGAR